MNEFLEANLELTTTQPDCIPATFTNPQTSAFTIAEDERGTAFLFDRSQAPTAFMELIKTAPGKIRGNHVHQACNEMLYVVSGKVELYLLCKHGKHVLVRTMQKGDTALTAKGTPHALRSIQESECVVLFNKDPRDDRTKVPILKFA